MYSNAGSALAAATCPPAHLLANPPPTQHVPQCSLRSRPRPLAGTYNVSVVKIYKYQAPDTVPFKLTVTVNGQESVFDETITKDTPNTLSTVHLPACAQCPAITHAVPYP